MYSFACMNFGIDLGGLLLLGGIALGIISIPILLVAYVVNRLSEQSFRVIFIIEGILLSMGAVGFIRIHGWELYSIPMFLGTGLCAVLAAADWGYVHFIKGSKSEERHDYRTLGLIDRSFGNDPQ